MNYYKLTLPRFILLIFLTLSGAYYILSEETGELSTGKIAKIIILLSVFVFLISSKIRDILKK